MIINDTVCSRAHNTVALEVKCISCACAHAHMHVHTNTNTHTQLSEASFSTFAIKAAEGRDIDLHSSVLQTAI